MNMTAVFAEIQQSINSGAISFLPKERRAKFSAALCQSQAFAHFGAHEYPQICETVRVHVLRAHMEPLQNHVADLQDHITDLNTKNTAIQKWVIALAVAALISTMVQTVLSIATYSGTPPTTQVSAPIGRPPQPSATPAAAAGQVQPAPKGASPK